MATQRHMPEYGFEPVENLPVTQGTRGKSNLYHDLLSRALENPGQWFQIAKFHNPTGATSVKRQLEKGEKEIPAGEFEFHSARVGDESYLYVKAASGKGTVDPNEVSDALDSAAEEIEDEVDAEDSAE